MNLSEVLDRWRKDPHFLEHVTWRTSPARPARTRPLPPELPAGLVAALRARGVDALYAHQAEARARALNGEDVVVVTPTASGKSLCFQLPILERVAADPRRRTLCLFPTKALAQDQRSALVGLSEAAGQTLRIHTYDGDTPPEVRRTLRRGGQVILTNPDMLHSGILPNHTRWVELFEHLDFVVIDEVHAYRGVFGSHVANVLRRLRRIAAFYGADPTFLLTSATIQNPGEHASRLVGRPVRVVDENGAPQGERHFLLYNPPVVNRALGLRRSTLLTARDLASTLIGQGVSTLVFTRSRLEVEVLYTYLEERHPGKVAAYRGGYLPGERRAVEKALREGRLRGAVSTNALELGVDIGSLDAVVMVGYPGTLASTAQESGRAGRRLLPSLALLVLSSSATDQYLARHPEYLEGDPEQAQVNADNLHILMHHLKCAAFELPLDESDAFGPATVGQSLRFLEEQGVVRRRAQRYHWVAETFPAHEISLRSAAGENVIIVDRSQGGAVIGEVDRFSAPLLVHEEAIYLHRGQTFQVETLDLAEKKAFVRPVDVDYYTDAELMVDLRVLTVDEQETRDRIRRRRGAVRVTRMATLFKKIRFHTHENIGSGPIRLPEDELQTQAFTIEILPAAVAEVGVAQLGAALAGLGNLLRRLAPLFLMCDPVDLGLAVEVRSPFSRTPALTLYDSYPGGIGLADRAYALCDTLLAAAGEAVSTCACELGCPACVGASLEGGDKAAVVRLIGALGTGDVRMPGVVGG